MIEFWIAAALMALLAVGFVFWPQLRSSASRAQGTDRAALVLDLFNEHRDQLERQLEAGEMDHAQFAQLLQELQLSLLQDSSDEAAVPVKAEAGHRAWLLPCLAALVPLAALLFYWQHGNIEDVHILELREQYFQQQVLAHVDTEAGDEETIGALTQRLEARLQRQPDNLGNRYLLARTHLQQGNFSEAISHYSRLLQVAEPPAHIVAELAQTIFLASGNRITPEVDMLAQRALQLDPAEQTALGLAGISAFQQQEYAAAVDYWQRAVAQLDGASEGGQALRAGIARARQLLLGDGANRAEQLPQPEPGNAAARIEVQVQLAASVQAEPGDTVFVYARAWQGPKMPLAIARLTVADLPRQVILDESMAMAPGMSMGSFPSLELVARISKSGSPTTAPGDWQVTLGPLRQEQLSQPLVLEIADQVP